MRKLIQRPRKIRASFQDLCYRPRVTVLESRALPSFFAPFSMDTGSNPKAVAIGDFNDDGIPDLAVANSISRDVSILLGNDDGSFQPSHNYSAGASPIAVAVGDFNGDGIPDLAVANSADARTNNLSVLLGNGDGSFQAPRSFPAGAYPDAIAVGDFNGDGVLDVAVTDGGTTPYQVRVLLGAGDGSFQPAQSLAAPNRPQALAVGDFNGDGALDLVTANDTAGSVSVFLGNGDGSFQPDRTFAAGSYPHGVTVGDFNGDGIADLAVADEGTNPSFQDGRVSVLLGNGDGSFQPAQSFAAGSRSYAVVAGDFNGDGISDLAVANFDSGTVSILLGNGDGSFQAAQDFAAGSYAASLATADFNNDSLSDLAVENFGGVAVLLSNGDGSFPTPSSFPAGTGPEAVAVADFNGDGIPDLAVADSGSSFGHGSGAVLLNNGNGTFQPPLTFATGAFPTSIAVGDFNGDGIPDLVTTDTSHNTVRVQLGNGDGSFQTGPDIAAGSSVASVAVGDFNGDGIPDLAVTNDLLGGSTASILLGNGDGSFQPPRSFRAGFSASGVAVGDFNGDGILDLAVGNYFDVECFSVLLGNGDGTFQAPRTYDAIGSPDTLTVADFNGDGHPDLALATSVGIVVLLNNGDGTFGTAQRVSTVGSDVAVGDFNGDSLPDLAVVYAGGVRVLLGNGDGTFQTLPMSYLAGTIPTAAAVADFNGDGWPDLAVANRNSNDVSLLLNDTHWLTALGGPLPHGRHPAPVRAATAGFERIADAWSEIRENAAGCPQDSHDFPYPQAPTARTDVSPRMNQSLALGRRSITQEVVDSEGQHAIDQGQRRKGWPLAVNGSGLLLGAGRQPDFRDDPTDG